jgi:hypothetical protein
VLHGRSMSEAGCGPWEGQRTCRGRLLVQVLENKGVYASRQPVFRAPRSRSGTLPVPVVFPRGNAGDGKAGETEVCLSPVPPLLSDGPAERCRRTRRSSTHRLPDFVWLVIAGAVFFRLDGPAERCHSEGGAARNLLAHSRLAPPEESLSETMRALRRGCPCGTRRSRPNRAPSQQILRSAHQAIVHVDRTGGAPSSRMTPVAGFRMAGVVFSCGACPPDDHRSVPEGSGSPRRAARRRLSATRRRNSAR